VRRVAPAVVFVATFAVFAPLLGAGFLNLDDDSNLVRNPHWRGLSGANLAWMWTRVSPFYSPLGVTENERPVLAHEVLAVFERTGFTVSTQYLSGLAYRYVASQRARLLLPVYNFIDAVVFGLGFMERLRPFVLTVGTKR